MAGNGEERNAEAGLPNEGVRSGGSASEGAEGSAEGGGAPVDPRLQKDLELLRRMRPIDDGFMRVVFRGQMPLAQRVLRAVTGIGDLVLEGMETERDLKRLAGARSVVLDVWGRDSEGREYDLEIQRPYSGAKPKHKPKRARYHASAMDVEVLLKGHDFDRLPESYVVFVTEEDFFGDGAGVHAFERFDASTGAPLGDGSHVLYANAEYNGDDELGALLRDFLRADPEEMETRELAERVRYLKEDPEGVAEMCSVMEEIRQEGVQLGLAEGREQGMAEGRAGALFDLAGKGLLSVDVAAGELSLTPEQFAERAKAAGYELA